MDVHAALRMFRTHRGFWRRFALRPQARQQMHYCITKMKCWIEKSVLYFSHTKSACVLGKQDVDTVLCDSE